MQILKAVFEIFFQKRCLFCKTHLLEEEKYFCLHCFFALPFTNYPLDSENPVNHIFLGKAKISAASSLFFFDKQGLIQNMLHNLKYNQKPDLGIYIAHLLFQKLEKNADFKKITAIVPVPIHWLKKQKRGYHQLHDFSKTLSEKWQIPYYPNLLKVNKLRFSQTHKNLSQRFENVKEKYILNPKFDLSILPENSCILLVDDVLTTGATLLSCIKVLEKINTKIMILTMAYVHNEYL